MSVLPAVRNRLIAVPAVVAVYGQRIYPTSAPQGVTPPYARLTIASGVDDRTLGGALGRRVNRVQVTSFARSQMEASEGAAEIYRALNDYQGGAIRGAAFANETVPDYEHDTGLYSHIKDFFVVIDV